MKKIMCFACGVMMALCLFGCSVWDGEDDMELTPEELEPVNHEVPKLSSGSGVSAIQTLQIYTVDSGEEQLVPLKVPLDADRVTPEFILDKVLENMDEKIVVTEINVEKSRIYVSFSEESAPLKKCSETFETLILDCISNSLLDNLSYVDEVVFRAEKGAYHSENYSFGLDEVYSTK